MKLQRIVSSMIVGFTYTFALILLMGVVVALCFISPLIPVGLGLLSVFVSITYSAYQVEEDEEELK